MAEFKKAIEKTLKPFARKVGADIAAIKAMASGSGGKVLNVVEHGVDNTGATDVSAKLTELFAKAYDENYTKVVFPDGVYKIDDRAIIKAPYDHTKSICIQSLNPYGATFAITGNERDDAQSGLCILPQDEEHNVVCNIVIDGFKFELKEKTLDAGGETANASGIITPSTSQTYYISNCVFRNLKFNGGYNGISINIESRNCTIQNITCTNQKNAINISSSVNNMIDSVYCNNPGTISLYAGSGTIQNIDLVYTNHTESFSAPTLEAHTISNIKIKASFKPIEYALNIYPYNNSKISNIYLDIDPIDDEESINQFTSGKYLPYFITITYNSSESLPVYVSDLHFDNFEEKYAHILEKIPAFAWIYNSNTTPIIINNTYEQDKLKYFADKSVYSETTIAGTVNKSFNSVNKEYKSRPFIGLDRNMNGTSTAYDYEGVAIYLGAKGTPSADNKNNDYSENTAGVKGDIFTELEPEKSGHFAYVSTYEHIKPMDVPRSNFESLTYNEADKTYAIKFKELPVWNNGTLKGTAINVGSSVDDTYNGVSFIITSIDTDTKTFITKAHPETKNNQSHPYVLGNSSASGVFGASDSSNKITPYEINRMKNMTYVTVPIIHSGSTENRPTEHLVTGQMYFDTTLGAPVFWNGTEWIQGNNGGSVDTSNLATKEEIKAIPAANITQDDSHYFVTKYQNKKLQDLYNKGEIDTKFVTKADLTTAIAAIPAPTVDTSNLVTKQEFESTLNAINEKLKELRGGNN